MPSGEEIITRCIQLFAPRAGGMGEDPHLYPTLLLGSNFERFLCTRRCQWLVSVVSDVCGVCFGGTVEAIAVKMGLPSPDLTIAQRGLKISKVTATAGAMVGVVCGCLMGMVTLLFIDTTTKEREKKQREMDTIFATILDDGHHLVGAEKCSLFFVDEDKGELWSKVATALDGSIKAGMLISIPITKGIAGEVVRTGQVINVEDTTKDERYFPDVDVAMKTLTNNILAVPVVSRSQGKDSGKVVAVIEMMNKASGPFDANDEKLVGMLAAHIAVFMKQLGENSGGTSSDGPELDHGEAEYNFNLTQH
ncbi:unnamed protein product [Choristocarpus tenellus]